MKIKTMNHQGHEVTRRKIEKLQLELPRRFVFLRGPSCPSWLKAFMSDTTNLNIAVVGGGPGGYAAAFLAADLGMTVTLIDPEVNPGGVCLYRGCIPSKALLHVAKLLEESHQAKNWGIDFAAPKIDLARLRSWKENVVKKLTGGLGVLSKQRKVHYVQGRAAFENSTTLRVTKSDGSEESLTFDRIIIATGSRPAIVPTLKLDTPRMMDSTGALNLEDIPGTLLVVGGGYIGLELGSVYAALGTRVTVVEMLPGLLPGADRDLVLPLHKRLEKMFDGILLNTTVASVKEEGNGIRATFEGPDVKEREKVFDRVLVSVGRKPNSEIPGLEKTRVQVGPARLHPGQQATADRRSLDLRHRRCGRRAHARAQSVARRPRCRRSHRRTQSRLRAQRHSRGRLHRSRGRLVRPDRDAGAKRKSRDQSRQVPLGRFGPRHHARPPRRHDQAPHSIRRPSACSASASWAQARAR